MNIKSVYIKNFRNFKDFAIDFSKGFQTIIGENNIGKSNLYWAIRLLLDSSIPPNARTLELTDFYGFKSSVGKEEHVIISIELFGDDLASFPTFHSLKTGEDTARITYLFAHTSRFSDDTESEEAEVDISQFRWRLFGGGASLEVDDILQLAQLRFSDLDGITVFYIDAFRKTGTELFGSTKSLLSKYCQTRSNSDTELDAIKKILSDSSQALNELAFMPEIVDELQSNGMSIAGKHFSFPLGLGFHSNYDIDAWNQLNLYYAPGQGKNVPIHILGLGQKNILYLSLIIASLNNSNTEHRLNLLLIEEPEAHLHPQSQKVLFSNLHDLSNTQVLMTSHSTHIASDCDYKSLNILYRDMSSAVRAFSPFKEGFLSERENKLLKRYLDATRSEMFFSSAVMFVEGVAEQFIIPAIAKAVYGFDLVEHNVAVVPIHCRFFDPYLKLVQNGNLEIPAVAIIDGDADETDEDHPETTAIEKAKALAVPGRVLVSPGIMTLEADLFPNPETNIGYLEACFTNLGHKISYGKLLEKASVEPSVWATELLNRVDGVAKKGRFAQELATLIDSAFTVPAYIDSSIRHIAASKGVSL